MRSTRLPSWIERLAGLSPRPAPPHVFALAPDKLSYARFRRAAGKTALERYESVALPPESFQKGILGGPPRQDANLSQAIATLIERVGAPVPEASLVLPDAWLRSAFAEVSDLPKDRGQLDEVLRFKLKRLVPFRVDELRLSGIEVSPLAKQEEPRRLMIGFALESLLDRLETLFEQAGTRLGHVGSASLSVLRALRLEGSLAGAADALVCLALVQDEGYTLVFARGGEPVLYRYKAAEPELPAAALAQRIERDLALTRDFLGERLPEAPLELVLLAARPGTEASWRRWLENGLESRTEPLDDSRLAPFTVLLPAEQAAAVESWLEVAPLVGAACLEVA